MVRKLLERCLTGGPFPSDDNSIFSDAVALVDLTGIFQRYASLAKIDQWAQRVHGEIRKAADLQEHEIRHLVMLWIRARAGNDRGKYLSLSSAYLTYCYDQFR